MNSTSETYGQYEVTKRVCNWNPRKEEGKRAGKKSIWRNNSLNLVENIILQIQGSQQTRRSINTVKLLPTIPESNCWQPRMKEQSSEHPETKERVTSEAQWRDRRPTPHSKLWKLEDDILKVLNKKTLSIQNLLSSEVILQQGRQGKNIPR